MKRLNVMGALLLASALASVGCTGDTGPAGEDGVDGADGTNGTDGTDGNDGDDGNDGTNGTDGTDGTDGADGADGADGMDGMDGESGIVDLRMAGDLKLYTLDATGTQVDGSDVGGTVRLLDLGDGETLVTISVTGSNPGHIHKAHIHDNTVVEGGPAAITLNPVDGATGLSETVVSELDDGTAITYDELLEFDGYVNVHADNGTPISAADIGGNELTGQEIEYDLPMVSGSTIFATARLQERRNGTTLLTIATGGGALGGDRLAHIHMNDVATGGAPLVTLTPVDETSQMSVTNVRETNAGDPITFAELVFADAWINVHINDTDTASAAAGDIGANDLTGTTEVYTLDAVDSSGISGTATFHERTGGGAIIEVELTGTAAGERYLAHVHDGTADPGGGTAAVGLTPIDGDSGRSVTVPTVYRAASAGSGSAATYGSLTGYNGYINIHDPDDPSVIVAAGDIGSNAP